MSKEDLPTAAFSIKHKFISNKNREDNRILATNISDYRESDVIDKEELVRRSDAEEWKKECADTAFKVGQSKEKHRVLELIDQQIEKLADNESGRMVKEEILEEMRQEIASVEKKDAEVNE